jgi:hypothetical protein
VPADERREHGMGVAAVARVEFGQLSKDDAQRQRPAKNHGSKEHHRHGLGEASIIHGLP